MLWTPLRDGRALHVEDVALGHRELGTKEHRRNGHAQQDGTHDAINQQQRVIEARAIDVAGLGTVLIANRLNDKAEQDEHPQPVGTAEAGAVEQRERGEEGAAKGH